jgi:hypothetical protein
MIAFTEAALDGVAIEGLGVGLGADGWNFWNDAESGTDMLG